MNRLSWGNCTQCGNYNSLIELNCVRCRLKVSKDDSLGDTLSKKSKATTQQKIDAKNEYDQKVLERLESKKQKESEKKTIKDREKRAKKEEKERLEREKNDRIIYNKILTFIQNSPKPVTLEQISKSANCHSKTAYKKLRQMSFRGDLTLFTRCTYSLNIKKKGVKLYWIKPFYVFHKTTIKVIEYLLSKDNYSALTPEIMREVGVSDVTICNRYLELKNVGNFLERVSEKKPAGGGRQPYLYRLIENPLEYKGVRDDLIFDQN